MGWGIGFDCECGFYSLIKRLPAVGDLFLFSNLNLIGSYKETTLLRVPFQYFRLKFVAEIEPIL